MAGFEDLYAVLELCVGLHRFINVELRSQGWYAVRIKLLPHPRIKAVWPYTTEPVELDAMHATGTPGMDACSEAGWSWRSQVVRIQYCHEVAPLSNIAPCFQVFVRQPHLLTSLDLRVQVELLAQPLLPDQLEMPFSVALLRTVAKEELVVRGAARGLLAYHPASWGSDWWGLCHVVLAACLVGFATRAGLHRMCGALGRDLRRSRGSSSAVRGPGITRRPSHPHSAMPHRPSAAQSMPGTIHSEKLAMAVPALNIATRMSVDTTTAGSSIGSPRWLGASGQHVMFDSVSGYLTPLASLPQQTSFGAPAVVPKPGRKPDASSSRVPCASTKTAITLLEALQAMAAGMHPAFCAEPGTAAAPLAGPAAKPVTSAGTMPPDARACVVSLFNALSRPLRACAERTRITLRTLPSACYAPQTYDAMRALLQDVPGVSQRVFDALSAGQQPQQQLGAASLKPQGLVRQLRRLGGPPPAASGTPVSHPTALPRPLPAQGGVSASEAGGILSEPRSGNLSRLAAVVHASDVTLDVDHGVGAKAGGLVDLVTETSAAAAVASWPKLPDTAEAFLALLPRDCTAGGALLYLHALLAQLTRAAATEWNVLQWLMQHTCVEVTRWLRYQWEAEQPALTAPWIKTVMDLSEVVSAGTGVCRSAHLAHAQLLQNPPKAPPQVFRSAIWDRPTQQPVLLMDDGLAGYMHVTPSCVAGLLRKAGVLRSSSGGARAGLLTAMPGGPNSSHPLLTALAVRPVHLVVFVHGYEGAPSDLGPIKANIHALYPDLECRFSAANEGKEQDTLEAMGGRLAEEVEGWVAQMRAPGSGVCLGQLSFVAHSLGAMVVRAACSHPKDSIPPTYLRAGPFALAKQMEKLLPHLWMLLSIGAPHLGQAYNSNTLLNAGLGVLKVIRKGSCVQQLDMSDAVGHNPATAWLYRLNTRAPGEGGSLQAFKRVVLLACQQDRYVPAHSAELCACEASLKDRSWRGKAYKDMLTACTQGFGTDVDAPQLLRVGVHFPRGSRSSVINDVLGRTAHIALIDNDDFARLVAWGIVRRYNLFQEEDSIAWLA